MKTTKENQLIRHYKGGWYITLGHALHTETEEELVVYQSLNGNTRQCWAMPADDFMSTVELDNGRVRDRFEDVYEIEERLANCIKESGTSDEMIRRIRDYIAALKSTQNIVDCGYKMDYGFISRRLMSIENGFRNNESRVQLE